MKQVFEHMSPKTVFVFGMAQGFLVLCTIGFFVLLTSALTNGFGEEQRGAAAAPVPAAVGQEEVPQEIVLRDVDEERDHVRGAKNAQVTVVTYTDLECPFCKRFHTTMGEILTTYKDSVRMVYRNYPIDQLHSQARTEALATECAAEQGKYWEMTDLIFAETPSNDGLDVSKLPEYAKQVGLTVSTFTSCLNQKKYASKIQEDEADGQQAGARGTPYSVIIGPNGEKVPVNGAYPTAQIAAIIDSLIQS